MKKIFTILVVLIGFISSYAQTIYSENMGTTASGNPLVSAYSGWQNASPISYTGTASARTTTVSTGYTGASGSVNIFFSATTAQTFEIHGINTSAYAASGLQLSFGFLTTTATAVITVETSTDSGATWSPLTIPANSNTSWALKTITSGIPSSSNLYLRFTSNATSGGMRVDDVKIAYVSATCALSPGSPTVVCDAVTTGIDTYTATIPFTGGGTATYTITPTVGTVGGDNPSTTASGNILITGVSESVNNSVTITGGTCSFTIPITASVCKAVNSLPFTESFNYTPGAILTAQQAWSSLNSGDDILVSSGSLSFSGITSTANSATFSGAGAEAYAPFTTTNSGFLNAAFLFSVTDYSNVTTDLTNTYFALFNNDNSGGSSNARVWIRNNAGQYQFGLGAGTTPDTWSPNLYNVGTTQYLTLSYDFANNKLYLFENQKATAKSALATPTVTVTPTTAYTALGGFMLRQDAAGTTPTIVVDELNINTSPIVLAVSDVNSLKANFIRSTLVTNEITFGTKANVSVYNMNGQLLKSASVEKGGTLNVSSLAKGTYLVAGEVNGQKVAQKIIKQ